MNHRFDFQSNTKFFVMLFFIIGLILRTLFIHSIRLDYDEGLFLFIGYLYNENTLIEGIMNNFPNQNGIPFNQPPFVSILYSVLYSFFAIDYGIGRFINALLSSFCIILIYFIVKEIWDSKRGLIAAIIVMIDPTLTMTILMAMDGLTTFVFCVSCLATVKAIKNDTITWHLTAGITFSLCMLTKWTLTIVPITYVVYYMYHSRWIKKQNYIMSIKKIIASTSIALGIFLPWFIWMGLKGNFPILFGHGHHIRLTNPFNSIYQTWTHSPILFLIAIFSFMYFFFNNKKSRFPLLFGLFVIFPFFLFMPRYYDYLPALYLFAILGAEPCTYLFEQSFLLVSELRTSLFKLDRIKVDNNILLSTTIIILLIGANSGFTVKQLIFDQDQTVQQTVTFIKANAAEDTIIICPPHFGALLIPRRWISNYAGTLGDEFLLVYTPIMRYSSNYIEGVENGVVKENNTTFLFAKIATINDVMIYQILLNQTSPTYL